MSPLAFRLWGTTRCVTAHGLVPRSPDSHYCVSLISAARPLLIHLHPLMSWARAQASSACCVCGSVCPDGFVVMHDIVVMVWRAVLVALHGLLFTHQGGQASCWSLSLTSALAWCFACQTHVLSWLHAPVRNVYVGQIHAPIAGLQVLPTSRAGNISQSLSASPLSRWLVPSVNVHFVSSSANSCVGYPSSSSRSSAGLSLG